MSLFTRRAILVLTLTALFLLHPAASSAQREEQAVGLRYIITETTAIRRAPSITAPVLATLSPGTLVWRLTANPENTWQEVQRHDDSLTGWVPVTSMSEVALLIVKEQLTLREAAEPDAPFLRVLAPESEVWSFETIMVNDQVWHHVWTTGGITGWTVDGQLEPHRVFATSTVSLRSLPSDEIIPIVELPPNQVAVVLEFTPDEHWTRLLTPQSEIGWTDNGTFELLTVAANGQVRLPPGRQNNAVNLRTGPRRESSIIGRIFHETPVPIIGRDETREWLLIITPEGRVVWLHESFVYLRGRLISDLPIVTWP